MALEAIVPKGDIVDTSIMLNEMSLAINQTLELVDRDFRAVTRTWNTEVVFLIKKAALQGGDLSGSVSTDSKVFMYVSLGTKPHVIKPKNAKVLHFKSMYKPKTKPNTIGSSSGGAFGNDVFSKGVQHPGTEARNFHIEIAQRRQVNIQNFMTAAIMRAIKAAGKGF